MAGTATRPPLSVALCFGTFPPQINGGSEFLMHLASHLEEAGARCVVVTSRIPGVAEYEETGGINVYRFVDEWRLGSRGIRVAREVRRILEAEEIDVLHVLFPDSEVEAQYQIPALLSGRRPLVTTFWNLGLGRRTPLPLRLSSLALLARSTVLSSHDPFYLAQLRRMSLGRPVRWLPAGSNVGGIRRATPLPTEPHQLAFFGQLDTTRGVDTLFQAFAQLRREGRSIRLVMVGAAAREDRYAASAPAVWREYQRLRHLPAELGVDDGVDWTAYLQPEAVVAALADSICVFPYRRNSIGRSGLAAAFAAGAPVVLAGEPAGIAPLQPSIHVELAPPDDAPRLAAAIRRVLDNPGYREHLRTGSLAAAEMFDWPAIAQRAVSMYREAIDCRF